MLRLAVAMQVWTGDVEDSAAVDQLWEAFAAEHDPGRPVGVDRP